MTDTYRCPRCGELAPHGDERIVWLGWHESWLHRLLTRKNGLCWPWAHDWTISRVTVPFWDPGARGELWRCKRCPKLKAK